MEKLDLKGFIRLTDEICMDLASANVGNNLQENMGLKQRVHLELLKFGIYLVDADGTIDDKDAEKIRECLKIDMSKEEMLELKKREKVDERYGKTAPAVFKYAVLADAGRKLKPDPYKGQCAVIFYDTFKLFGQHILSVQTKEATEATMSRFTASVGVIEKFIKSFAVWYVGDQKTYHPIEPVFADPETEDEKAEKLEKLLEDLNNLTGLEGVKHQVTTLVNLIKVQKMRESQGMKVSDVSKHMVFSGNPGTGKTTVARMLGDIYKYLGVLQKGQLIEVDRGGLVRGYVGQTATRVQEVVEEALGGILFVDEAYTLTVGKGEGDFGQEAVDTLLKAMEDHRKELIVIVAGYTDLMEQFLSSNPGLKSRFSNFIYFDDYTAEELIDILNKQLKGQEYKLSPAAAKKAKKLIKARVENKPENFANARDIRNFMEHAIGNQATRIVTLPEDQVDKDVLCTLEAEDLEDFS